MTALLISLATLGLGAPPENPVFRQLVDTGVPVGGDRFVKIAPPTMPDGLDADAQHELIRRIAGPTRQIDTLMRNSIVAPFVLKIGRADAEDGPTPTRTVDVWFVAYGNLDQFVSEDFLDRMVKEAESDQKSKLPLTKGLLSDKQMQQRNLAVVDADDRHQRYCYSTFALFDRVLISATRQIVVTRQEDSVLLASIVDPRFIEDAEYPNRWRSIAWNEYGKHTLGPSHDYVSAGFYAKVTRLEEPAGALLIEHHHVFAEPEGWFHGKNLLRSKLPLVVQDTVRKLRRKLREKKEAASE